MGVIAVFTAAVIEVGEAFFWIGFLRGYPVTTGAEGLVGQRGEVKVCCAPVGRVRLRGQNWNARSEEPLELGEEVRVEAVDGLTLVVARVGNATHMCSPDGPAVAGYGHLQRGRQLPNAGKVNRLISKGRPLDGIGSTPAMSPK